VSEQVRGRLYSLSRLDELKGLTFDTFEPRGRKGLGEMQSNSLEMAFNQAQHYAKSLNGWLLLRGGYGCGKTHLAASIANFAVDMGVPTLFLTVPDLLDMLRFWSLMISEHRTQPVGHRKNYSRSSITGISINSLWW
jgi:DNA replication protein DnaC